MVFFVKKRIRISCFSSNLPYRFNILFCIHNEDVFQSLNKLSQIIHRMESTKPDYDEIKSFCRFLWEIFIGWSFISGYRKTDLINDIIQRLK